MLRVSLVAVAAAVRTRDLVPGPVDVRLLAADHEWIAALRWTCSHFIFLLAQEISLVQLGFVKSGLFDRKKARSVFVFEPDLVSFVIDHPCSLGGITDLNLTNYVFPFGLIFKSFVVIIFFKILSRIVIYLASTFVDSF